MLVFNVFLRMYIRWLKWFLQCFEFFLFTVDPICVLVLPFNMNKINSRNMFFFIVDHKSSEKKSTFSTFFQTHNTRSADARGLEVKCIELKKKKSLLLRTHFYFFSIWNFIVHIFINAINHKCLNMKFRSTQLSCCVLLKRVCTE